MRITTMKRKRNLILLSWSALMIIVSLILLFSSCQNNKTCPPCPQTDYTGLYDSLQTQLANATKVAQAQISADSMAAMIKINAKADSFNYAFNVEMDSIENAWIEIAKFKTDTPSITFPADNEPHRVRAYFDTEFNRIVIIGH